MSHKDGPFSPLFHPVTLNSCSSLDRLRESELLSEKLRDALRYAPQGEVVAWGLPFQVDGALLVAGDSLAVPITPLTARWLVFLHVSDLRPLEPDSGGFISPMPGEGRLNELAATYTVQYADGSEQTAEVRRRHQVGMFQRRWGENCFQAVPAHKPHPVRGAQEQLQPFWGVTQMRVYAFDPDPNWTAWLWAWENPEPEKQITGLRFDPVCGSLLLFGVSAGSTMEMPLRWRRRCKALLTLPDELTFDPNLDEDGLLSQIQIDLGQVISAQPQFKYSYDHWEEGYNNQLPRKSRHDWIVEYTSHPDARFHLWDENTIPVADVEGRQPNVHLLAIPPAHHRVRLRVVEQGSTKPVAVKLHLHGDYSEYLAPVDRHRIANPVWFEDYSVDFKHAWTHQCTYISGETVVDLPLGPVYAEISKGFEIRPVRMVLEVQPDTEEITIELERVLPWRERGWVTADTHVHFLSPMTALLEGAGEGVNVVNLLASQWGELMTSVGDFDGRTTWGSQEAGGEGEWLVRVGTENRQHVLGHISLLGYRGGIIAPMTTGGPDESALGDPIESLLTEWARQCRKQGGLVVLPHFPNPRAEHAASIVAGDVDALEMTSWADLYSGIDPYSLSDWYRYLNCGYKVAAVGGTDKMAADTALGTVRTYAHISADTPFTYDAWMDAVRRAETFVTYGPLLEFSVDGQPMGASIEMSGAGGTVDVTWQAASVTIPMTRVELIVNGEVRESAAVGPQQASGSWSVRVDRSSWLALLVRGRYPDKPEIVAAHSSPVMVKIAGSQQIAAADAVSILEQIEGAMAYLDTFGTRAEDRVYKRMRLVLVSAHRTLHNRMHALGYFHDHTPTADHKEHH